MGLSAKLAARSRHVCTFFGAGTAKACGLPDVAELQARVLVGLGAKEKVLFEKQLAGRNLEQALSRLRRIAALLSGDEKIDGLGLQFRERLHGNQRGWGMRNWRMDGHRGKNTSPFRSKESN